MIVYLEITSWTGMSIGARHFYGTLRGYDEAKSLKSIRLEHPMTQTDATARNKVERQRGLGFRYKAGMETEGFETKEELVVLARRVYRKHFPLARVLVQGRFAVAEPQTVLACRDAAFKRKVNALADKLERLREQYGDYNLPPGYDGILDKFDALMKQHGITR